MPTYLYRDARGHAREMEHRMLYSTGIVCECGAPMWRVPQIPMVNWQGGRAIDSRPAEVQRLLDTVPERKDAYWKMKDQHQRDGVTKFEKEPI